MSDFEKCITKTLRYEGVSSSSEGYVDHPNDKGGATKFGISYSFVKDTGNIDFFDMNGDMVLDKRDIQQLTFEKASFPLPVSFTLSCVPLSPRS